MAPRVKTNYRHKLHLRKYHDKKLLYHLVCITVFRAEVKLPI